MRKLTRKMFTAIRNELLNTQRQQSDIAADYGVGTSTVSVVNVSRTYENYLAHKKGLNPLRKRAVIPKKPQPTKVEKAKAAGLHPNDRVERATMRLGEELNALSSTPTREEFDRLERRISLQGRQISYLTQMPIIGGLVRTQLQRAAADDKYLRDREEDSRWAIETAHKLQGK